MHDGIRQPRTHGGTPCVLPNERTLHVHCVEIEHLQILVDPAHVGDRTPPLQLELAGACTAGILQYNPIQFQKSDQSDFLK